MMGNGFGGGMWLFGPLALAGLALLVMVAVRVLGGGIGPTTKARRTPSDSGEEAAAPPRSPARQILEERYARGELSTEEYRERLQTLDET